LPVSLSQSPSSLPTPRRSKTCSCLDLGDTSQTNKTSGCGILPLSCGAEPITAQVLHSHSLHIPQMYAQLCTYLILAVVTSHDVALPGVAAVGSTVSSCKPSLGISSLLAPRAPSQHLVPTRQICTSDSSRDPLPLLRTLALASAQPTSPRASPPASSSSSTTRHATATRR
jgi:hypothetical protein